MKSSHVAKEFNSVPEYEEWRITLSITSIISAIDKYLERTGRHALDRLKQMEYLLKLDLIVTVKTDLANLHTGGDMQ